MKYKLINSEFDPQTGISTAVISCKYGEFEGVAHLHTDDKLYASKFTGPAIAENRAYVNALKYKRKLLVAQRDALGTLEQSLWDTPRSNSNSYEWKRIIQELERKDNEIDEVDKQIEHILIGIDKVVAQRINFIDHQIKHNLYMAPLIETEKAARDSE